MHILGRTDKGDLIIQVSPEEWEAIQNQRELPSDKSWVDTEARAFFEQHKLRGVPWRKALKILYESRKFDGSVESLKKFVATHKTSKGNNWCSKRTEQRFREILGLPVEPDSEGDTAGD